MVYFECQKCNETIKKPKLFKHLLVCRSQYVSCIDCLMVFEGNAWEAHTSCVSEAQKYEGKLYQAKQSANKGQVKQDSWVENVQKCISDPSSSISPTIKGYLEKLIGFNNIPRKQRPFENFVKNSLKIWDSRIIGDIWKVISAANVSAKAPPAKPGPGVPDSTASQTSSQWAGWKRALDAELQEAGGPVKWQRLAESLVERCRKCGGANGTSEEELRWRALASIPEGYLSKQDEMVCLPCSS